MLDTLFIISIFALLTLTVFGTFEFKNKFLKWTSIISILIFLLSCISAGIISDEATSEPEISRIEISEIYKIETNETNKYKDGTSEYYVKFKENDTPSKVTVNEVYKGDGNYLIRYYHPNMTNTHEFFLDKEKTSYDLVVTDLNITELSSIN